MNYFAYPNQWLFTEGDYTTRNRLSADIIARYTTRIKVNATEVDPYEILNLTARFFDMTVDEVKKRARNRRFVVLPRQVYAHFMKENTHYSYSEIGGILGGYDHATTIHSRKTINNLCETDIRVKELVGHHSIYIKSKLNMI